MCWATAQLLASRGARISVADPNEPGLQTAMATLPGSADGKHMYQTGDVRSTGSVDAWIETTEQKLRRLDGAVNMAGVITKTAHVDQVEGQGLGVRNERQCDEGVQVLASRG